MLNNLSINIFYASPLPPCSSCANFVGDVSSVRNSSVRAVRLVRGRNTTDVMVLRQNIPRSQEDRVPFVPGEGDFRCLDAFLEALNLHRAGDGLQFCRVAQEPREGDGGRGH